MSVDPDGFRAVLGRFATGVTVVTTRDAAGVDHGMTVSAFGSASLVPPLVVVCLDRLAHTLPVLAQAGFFAVNILAQGQEALSRRFAWQETGRFDGIGYTRGQSGAVLLDETLAWLECRVVARHDAGDHVVFLGAVDAAEARSERPLLYYRGGYAGLER